MKIQSPKLFRNLLLRFFFSFHLRFSGLSSFFRLFSLSLTSSVDKILKLIWMFKKLSHEEQNKHEVVWCCRVIMCDFLRLLNILTQSVVDFCMNWKHKVKYPVALICILCHLSGGRSKFDEFVYVFSMFTI